MGSTFRLSVNAKDVLQRVKIEINVKTSSKALEHVLLNYRPTKIQLCVAEDRVSELSHKLANVTRVLELIGDELKPIVMHEETKNGKTVE